MTNLHINHPLVIDMAKNKDISRIEAIAELTAEDNGVQPHEMQMYLEEFHKNMAESMTYTDSISRALVYTFKPLNK
jgi:hypothetical protein